MQKQEPRPGMGGVLFVYPRHLGLFSPAAGFRRDGRYGRVPRNRRDASKPCCLFLVLARDHHGGYSDEDGFAAKNVSVQLEAAALGSDAAGSVSPADGHTGAN